MRGRHPDQRGPRRSHVNYTWNTGATGIQHHRPERRHLHRHRRQCQRLRPQRRLRDPARSGPLCEVSTGCYEDCGPNWSVPRKAIKPISGTRTATPSPGPPTHVIEVNATGLFWVMVTAARTDAPPPPTSSDFTLLDCSCDFEPIIEVTSEEDCCVMLSFDNNSTGTVLQLDVHTHGEPALVAPIGPSERFGRHLHQRRANANPTPRMPIQCESLATPSGTERHP